jgi:hypothetical protein
MFIFFSENNYNKICIKFEKMSPGCFINVNEGDNMCWDIKTPESNYIPIDKEGKVPVRNNQGENIDGGSGNAGHGGPMTNPSL